MSEELAKELALVTAVILREDTLGGSLFQTFDVAYNIAKAFTKLYPCDCTWVDLDYEETIIDFVQSKKYLNELKL